jgi:hypothetical protein
LTYHATYNDALNLANPIASPVVSPGITTKYYIRRANIPSCFDIDSVLLTIYIPIVLNASAPTTQICPDGSVILTVSTSNLTPDCTLYWQSYNGATWSDIAGATGSVYTTSPTSSAKTYRVRVNCTSNQCADECSNP